MPGLVGLITRMPAEKAIAQLEHMVDTLVHEPFYRTGTWIDRSLGIYVGWAAREGSFCDGMPLRNEPGDVVLLFSGEEFSDPGTVSRLREKGHNVGTGVASYLVHLYEERADFIKTLNGRFHGILIDQRRREAILFNDRFGMHRLYYHQTADGFYFGAEAKAILAVRPETRQLNAKGLGEFIACGSVLENRTLFEGVDLLPQGSAWKFRNSVVDEKQSYFDASQLEELETLSEEAGYRELRQAFSENLPRYFGGDGKVAMSLTGGLDTRMILAWRKPSPESLPCYTFGGIRRECEDVRIARRLAEASGQSYQVVDVKEEFLERFSYYAERAVYLTDGCVDVSRAPDLYLNERARLLAPVRMTGNYGGEVLRAVRAFKSIEPPSGIFHADILPQVRAATDTYNHQLSGSPLSFALFKQLPWNHYGILALEESQLSLRSPFLDNDFVRAVFRMPRSVLEGNGVSLRLIGDGDPSLLRIRTDRGIAGEKGGFRRATSQAALEFLFKAEYGYDMGMPQSVAKIDYLLSPLKLERLFLGRHKIFHFRTWYRDILAYYVQEMLLDPKSLSRSYVDAKGVQAAVRGHIKGNQNYTNQIHTLLTLEILHRLFLDEPGRDEYGKDSVAQRDTFSYCGKA